DTKRQNVPGVSRWGKRRRVYQAPAARSPSTRHTRRLQCRELVQLVVFTLFALLPLPLLFQLDEPFELAGFDMRFGDEATQALDLVIDHGALGFERFAHLDGGDGVAAIGARCIVIALGQRLFGANALFVTGDAL